MWSQAVYSGEKNLLGAQAFFPPSHPYVTQFEHTHRNIVVYEINSLVRVARAILSSPSLIPSPTCQSGYRPRLVFVNRTHISRVDGNRHQLTSSRYSTQTIPFLVFRLCFCLLLFLHEPCSLCCCFLALLLPSLQFLCAQQVLSPGWLFPEAYEKGLEKERSTTETNCSS